MDVKLENKIIRGGIIIFWWLFWLSSFVGKVFAAGNFWFAKSLIIQIESYLSPLGLENYATTVLALIGILELAAILLLSGALFCFLLDWNLETHRLLFFGTLCGLLIFSIFIMGDQFLTQPSLLSHTVYWLSIVLSWYIFTHSEKLLELYLNQN